jgi:hypothetical protein
MAVHNEEELCYYREGFGKNHKLKHFEIRFMPSKPLSKKTHVRCMMEANKPNQMENTKLLKDIVDLKIKLSQLYNQYGPNTSEYVSLSIQLDKLMNVYFEEKVAQLH